VDEYLLCLNGAEAARRAGYAAASSDREGHRLLRNAEVRAAVEAALEDVHMAHAEVRARIAEHARADLADFVTFAEEHSVGTQLMSTVKAEALLDSEVEVLEAYIEKLPEAGLEPTKEDHARLAKLKRDHVEMQVRARLEPKTLVLMPGQLVTRRVAVLDLEKAEASGKLHLVQEAKYDERGRLQVKLHDKLAAQMHLDKMHALAKARDPSGAGGDGQLDAALAKMGVAIQVNVTHVNV
jgi:hypothetical protein